MCKKIKGRGEKEATEGGEGKSVQIVRISTKTEEELVLKDED